MLETGRQRRMQRAAGAALALALLAAAAGCPRKQPATPPDAKAHAPDAPGPAARYERCAGVTPDREPPPAHLFGLKLVPRGALLAARRESAPPRRIALGVLGDTKEALPTTLERLRRLLRRFHKAGVSATVLLGGIDPTFEGVREILGVLKEGGPVLALPGDRASRSGFQAAAEAYASRVVDLSRVRAIATPWLGMVAVPGYYLPHHLLAGEQGCSYDADDIRALVGLARELPAPRLLLAHGPPRGAGEVAVDRAFGQVNIGDPLLRRLMSEAKIRFGLFAHVHESSGHATTLDGAPVSEMVWSDSLLLNVGSADSVPHEQLGGGWSRGSAAIFEVRGERARYHMIDLSRLPAASEEGENEDKTGDVPKGGN